MVREWMTTLDATQKLALDTTWHAKLQSVFCSARVDDETMCEAMRTVQQELRYLSDPHTAVGFSAAMQLGYLEIDIDDDDDNNKKDDDGSLPAALLATASPCKFEHSVTVAIGKDKWEEYVSSSDFSDRARALLDKAEIEPVRYRAVEGKTLKEIQPLWEDQARGLVKRLNSR